MTSLERFLKVTDRFTVSKSTYYCRMIDRLMSPAAMINVHV